MATILEQGIAEFQKGNIEAATKLFEAVLQADDQNDRALVWMSKVVSADEQSLWLERALKSNPHNADAKAMLQTLSIPTKAVAPIKKSSGGLLKESRKAFPVPEDAPATAPPMEESTFEMPADDALSGLRQSQVSPKSAAKSQPLPLLPAIVLGSLSFMAIGGLFLWLLAVLLT